LLSARAAVEQADGPLEVIAGPGAGKALILVERAARLHEGGAMRARISGRFDARRGTGV
jgi:superfamily I DNA/RNA helicase